MLKTRLLLGWVLAVAATLTACSTRTNLGREGEDAGSDVQPATGCVPAATSVYLGCNEDPSLPKMAGSCETDGTCVCYPGFVLNPTSKRCKLDPAADAGVIICTVGADQTCNDDLSLSSTAGSCVGGVACACKTGFLLNPATGRCKAGSPGDAGADSAPGGLVCTFLVDQTCNDDATFGGTAGTCAKDGTCACNSGFAVNPASGRCRAVSGSDAGPITGVCTPGMDQTCNDLASMSALAGTCRNDGTCTCRSGYVLNPSTGRCGGTGVVADASADKDSETGKDTGTDVTDAFVGRDSPQDSAGVCTPGMDQTCNDSPIASDVAGTCQSNRTCACRSGYVLNPTTGRCASAPRDASPDLEPACSYPINETCNHNRAAMDSIRGTCQPDGTCVCLADFVLVPSTGRCDLPHLDAGADAAAVCTPGKDQTCNDSPAVSSLWGTCRSNGTCACNPGYVVNASSGRCMVPAAGACSGTYDACGCGCCGGTSPQPVCYYPSAGDSLTDIIAADQATKNSTTCATVGCSLGQRYLCCIEATAEPAGSAQYSAQYVPGGLDRIYLSKTGTDGNCVSLTLANPSPGSDGRPLRLSLPPSWEVEGSISASLCNSTTVSKAAIGAQGTVSLSPSGDFCALNAHITLFFAATADAPVTTMRIDADDVAIGGEPPARYCH